MPQQIDDQQYYAIKACLERAYIEIKDAFEILYGKNSSMPNQGAAPLLPNTKNQQFKISPPLVTKDHQSTIDGLDPAKQEEIALSAEEQAKIIRATMTGEVLVQSVTTNGQGDYYATVLCRKTNQEACVSISREEYIDLQDIKPEDNKILNLSDEDIDTAEWAQVDVRNLVKTMESILVGDE